MGSGASREDVIASKWWEAKAQQMLRTTTNTGKVEVICSLLPFEDGKTAVRLLKARPDLDTLFALHCKYQDLCEEQHADPSSLTVDFKANEIWRVLRMPAEYSGSPWDSNWQPPLSGTASKIADEFHAAVCRAVFRIPFLDLVKWALGYDDLFVKSLFDDVCDVRDRLRREIKHNSETKSVYREVEKILQSRHIKLAHWIVASSLSESSYSLQVAPASMLDTIQNLFATRNLNLILERLPVFDQRWKHISQKYNWDKWSMDLDFWNSTYQVLWSETPIILVENPDLDERLCFLGSFESVPEDRVRGIGGKLLSFLKRLQRGQ